MKPKLHFIIINIKVAKALYNQKIHKGFYFNPLK